MKLLCQGAAIASTLSFLLKFVGADGIRHLASSSFVFFYLVSHVFSVYLFIYFIFCFCFFELYYFL